MPKYAPGAASPFFLWQECLSIPLNLDLVNGLVVNGLREHGQEITGTIVFTHKYKAFFQILPWTNAGIWWAKTGHRHHQPCSDQIIHGVPPIRLLHIIQLLHVIVYILHGWSSNNYDRAVSWYEYRCVVLRFFCPISVNNTMLVGLPPWSLSSKVRSPGGKFDVCAGAIPSRKRCGDAAGKSTPGRCEVGNWKMYVSGQR